MKKLIRIILITIIALIGVVVISPKTSAQSCSNKDECQKLISDYESKLSSLKQQKNTLSSQISLMDTQINLTAVRVRETEYKIVKTEEEILSLGDKIEGLDDSLDRLGKILIRKIVDGYKRRETPFIDIFIDSEHANTLLNRYKYIRSAQENDRKLAFQVQQAKLNFEEQKNVREEKRIELSNLKVALDKQRVDLANQKAAKQNLLSLTQNDEKTYQTLLAKARAEFAAIQGIVSGAGTETLLREVRKGDSIGTVIAGASCNSSGTHLHFIIKEGGGVIDPFNKLRSIDHVNYSNGDNFNPSGDWDWPIPAKIEFHQGYGVTWFARTYGWYPSHNGIDVSGSSNTITAIADGSLYRGSFAGFNGCTLPYALLKHKDSNYETLYLHSYTL